MGDESVLSFVLDWTLIWALPVIMILCMILGTFLTVLWMFRDREYALKIRIITFFKRAGEYGKNNKNRMG